MTQATGGVVTEAIVNSETFRIHTFTSSGNFTVNEPGTIEYLIVGGGGGGGGWAGGGGGGGGMLTGTASAVAATYPVVVGAGGTAAPANTYTNNTWSSGGNSSWNSITATGGGAGATFNLTPTGSVNGGSGGGASYNTIAGTGVAGQGNAGSPYSATYAGGGGGGAGAAGSGADGGVGLPSSITGTSTYYAGGGAASRGTNSGAAGTGGLGGGANGIISGGPAPSGTANTGGGGAGAYTPTSTGTSQTGSGAGGSGTVVIRYSIGFVPGVYFNVSGAGVTAANEGSTVTVRFIGAAATGAINYTITGVSTADIGGASLTGTVNLVDYQATLTLVLTEDVSTGEGAETMNVSFVENSITYQADLTINDTSSALSITPSTAVPGNTVTVTLNTGNNPQANGTEIPYTISGEYITAETIGQPLTGVFVVNSNTAQFSFVIGYVTSTTLSVTSFGATATCAISFTPTITTEVVESDYTDTEVNTATFSILPFSSVPITLNTADNVETGFVQISTVNYVNYAAPTTVTDTVENGGLLDIYIVQPLGQELIREFWI